jgi:sodium transport system permease protein
MQLKIVAIIFRKEILDMLRDKRTLVAMLGIPIVLYPLLFIVGSQAFMVQQSRVDETASVVAIAHDTSNTVYDWLRAVEMVRVAPSNDPESDLLAGKVDAVIAIDGAVEEILSSGETLPIEIRYDESEGSSREAMRRLVTALNDRYDVLLDTRLETINIEKAYVDPLDIKRKNVAPPSKTTGMLLGSLMPLIMIVMVGVGAFYPAIDLTAGEKERGTFETLLSTPTRTIEIVYGKFLAVFALALLTGLLNLVSMILTLYVQLNQLQQEMDFIVLRIDPTSIFAFTIVMIPLAFLISAVMMSVAVLARGFREGQNMLTPFLMGLLFPAGLAAIPDMRLTATTQFIPIANVALLFKDLMTDRGTLQDIFAVLMSTIAYALLALLLASRIFQREEVILNEERGIPNPFKRDNFKPSNVPTSGMVVFLFSICMLMFFYGGTPLQTAFGIHGVYLNLWLFFLLPTVLLLIGTRVRLTTALNIRTPSPLALPAVLLICAGWIIIVLQLGAWHDSILPMPQAMIDTMNDIMDWQTTPFLLLLFAVAISPAICEEFLFRGAILSGLRGKMPVWILLPLIGILFGAAHVSVYKFLVTSASGIVLTYLVWRSGSIFTSVLAHAIINAGLIFVQIGLEQNKYLPDNLIAFMQNTIIEQDQFPIWTLGVAATSLAAGVAIIEFTHRRSPVNYTPN